jgi:hypothetical protein
MQNERNWEKLIIKKVREGRIKYLHQYTAEKENAILLLIQVYGIKGGISHDQLAQIADLDRKSLRKYTQHLMKDGKISRVGTHGKYFPTEEGYKDPLLNATLFGDHFRSRLLDNKEDLVLCNKIIRDFRLNKEIDCTTYITLYEPKFANGKEIERALFEFSNRIGAFITYALIQTMNPDNNKMSLSAREQDEIVKKWAQNSISRILPFLVRNFNDLVYRAKGQYPSSYDEQVKFMDKRPKFVLVKPAIDQLLSAFRRLYPRLGYEFDKMILELPESSEYYKMSIEAMREKRKQQQSCEHVYIEPPTITSFWYSKQCYKCQYIKKVKNPMHHRKAKK